MRMKRFTPRAFLPSALLLCAPALSAAECLPRIEQGWVRPPPVAMPMMAGFMRIENPCDAPIAIVAASSPSFAEVSIHETREVDGVNRMREVERLDIAPGKSIELAPGGLHLMLYRPQAALAEGQRVPVVLTLADGRSIGADLQVRPPSRPAPTR